MPACGSPRTRSHHAPCIWCAVQRPHSVSCGRHREPLEGLDCSESCRWRGRHSLPDSVTGRVRASTTSAAPTRDRLRCILVDQMNLDPFVRVDDTPFSASREEVVKMRGKPTRTCRNGVGLNELDYESVVYRFQDCGRLEEITMQAPVVNIGNLSVPFAALASFVRTTDPSAFEKAGFLITPKFGFAFDPEEPCWITALAAHCLDSWRAI